MVTGIVLPAQLARDTSDADRLGRLICGEFIAAEPELVDLEMDIRADLFDSGARNL